MRAESIMSMRKVVKETSLRATLPMPIDSIRGLSVHQGVGGRGEKRVKSKYI
jgi:hypothetical protein